MDELFIMGTPHTAEINFCPEKNLFIISGRSTPEDADIYYYPVIKYLQLFKKELDKELQLLKKELNKEKKEEEKEILFEFRLVYYNSSSMRYLNSVMQGIESISEIKNKLKINWYYDTDDEYLEELGSYMKDNYPSLNIELIGVAPPPKKGKKF
jgi:hypothetical protein